MRHAERVGCVREGVKRKAYRRHGEWVDGVMFGLFARIADERFEQESARGPKPLDEETPSTSEPSKSTSRFAALPLAS